MTPWKITNAAWSEDGSRLSVWLESGTARKAVHLTAGIVAATGQTGPPLHDDKVIGEGKR